MPLPHPELTLSETQTTKRLLTADSRWRLAEQEWVPIVSSMRRPTTVGEHHQVLTNAVFLTAAYAGGLVLVEPELVRVRLTPNFIAWLTIDGLNVTPNPVLTSVRTNHNGVIYDGNYEATSSAVFSSTATEHEAYTDAAEPLGEVGLHVNQLAVDAVARRLNSKHPGFELPAKLEAEGIPVSI